MVRRRPAFLLAAVLLAAAPGLAAQAPEPVATLDAWAEDVWLDLLDRDGTFHGRLAEEGVFQRFHPRMDHEYLLDVRTGLFDPAEDARWSRWDAGLRVAGASVSHANILNAVDWRQPVPVTDRVDLLARYRRDHTFTDRRDYPRVGVRWREALGTAWTAGAHLGVHFFKPSADVELTLARAWNADGAGGPRWNVELGVAALDAFSDAIFQGLGVAEEDAEAHLDYRAPPWAARVALTRAGQSWRAELRAGASTRSEVEATFPGSDRDPFTQSERVSWAGALLQIDPLPDLAVAAWGAVARADTDRRGSGGDAPGFVLREQTTRVGMRHRYTLSADVLLVGEAERVWRPERRALLPGGAPGDDVDHDDRATFGRLAVVRRPSAGWTGELAWAALERRPGELLPHLGPTTDHRLVTAWGWRFPTGFEVTAGLRWDLDALGRNTFDGGHLRLMGRW